MTVDGSLGRLFRSTVRQNSADDRAKRVSHGRIVGTLDSGEVVTRQFSRCRAAD
jgi:hypothetical protein